MSSRLKTFALLAELSATELELLDELLEEREYDDGNVVFSRHDEAEGLLLILEGAVRLEHEGKKLGTLPSGEPLGGAALVAIGKRECDAIAIGQTHVLMLDRECYHRLRVDSPGTALVLQEGILRGLAAATRALAAEHSAGVLDGVLSSE